ncbi:MAG: hypothetical protein QM606_05745, partial [Leucobacter sp.]
MWKPRGVAAIGALSCLALVAAPVPALAAEDSGWTATVQTRDTGVNNGYQLAFDDDNGKVYFTDAKWRSETRGTKESASLDWTGVTLATDKNTTHSSMRSTFSPYGVAVDGKLDGGTIVTTTARQRDAAAGYGGGVVIYKASQGAPKDSDRVFKFSDGTPIFNGVRRVAVNENTHQAFVTNLGNSRGSGSDGYIAVLDLTKRGAAAVQARVTIPDAVGAVGVDVDEANNLVYVGSMTGEKLYVIDMSKVDTTDPQDLTINDAAVTELPAVVGANARPTYSPELKRVYVSAYASPAATISVVDADPASGAYGTVIDTVETGPSNAVAVDGDRGLLYSANLGDKKVAVFDTVEHELLTEAPTSGNAVNLGIDPVTDEVWVSNFSNAGKTDVFKVEAVTTTPEAEDETKEATHAASGAVATYDANWTVDGKLKVSGTNWKHPEGGGSHIAVKYARGAVTPNTPLGGDVPDDVWALIEADADGNWTAELEFPTVENSNLTEAWAAGSTQTINLLTGSMRPGDTVRSVPLEVTVAEPQPTEPVTEWKLTSSTALDTNVQNGYQLAFDDDNRQVYFSDAKWRTETKNPAGEIVAESPGTGKIVQFDSESKAKVSEHSFLDLSRHDGGFTVSEGTGKVVPFDAKTLAKEADHSYLDLTRNDGTGKESEPLDWTGVTADSNSSMRSTFSPYGIAVDGKLDGGTIITTTARQRDAAAGYGGGIVIYKASQGAPTDADRVFAFEDGTPIFNGVRRVAVNENTHQAFVTNLGNSRGSGSDGYIAVLDLTKRGADAVLARVTIPDAVGAVGVDVDEANNLVYVGSMTGEKLYVIDMSKVDTTKPQDLTVNNAAVTELDAVVGANARPTYSPELKRVYISAYNAPTATISVVDADPASADYGTVIDTVETGPTNAVAVDGERGLLYSANLGDQKVVVFDTEQHEVLVEVPTSGNAVNLGIDPDTRDVWVSNFSNAGKTDVITVKSPEEPTDPEPLPFTDVEKGDPFYEEIDWMFQNGLTTGVKQSDGTVKYLPKTGVSREAMAAFLYRLEGKPAFDAPAVSPFADVKP